MVRSVFIKSKNEIELKNIELPSAINNQIKIHVDACGICGTDVTMALDGRDQYGQFGHEIAGTVIEAGPLSSLRVGERVALESSTACGKCNNCKDMKQELCSTLIPLAFTGFSDEMIVADIQAVPFNTISAEVACLAEPLGVAIDMVRLANIEIGSHVVVSGLGPIGLMAITLAKRCGAAKVYAAGPSHSKARNDLALEFGADELIYIDKTPIESYKFVHAPDRFLITSPPKTIPKMFRIAATGSIFSFIGIKFGNDATISFDANEFHFKKLQLRGSFAAPALMTPMALNLLETGIINGNALISHRFELKDINEAVRVACENKASVIKVVVVNK